MIIEIFFVSRSDVSEILLFMNNDKSLFECKSVDVCDRDRDRTLGSKVCTPFLCSKIYAGFVRGLNHLKRFKMAAILSDLGKKRLDSMSFPTHQSHQMNADKKLLHFS